MSALNAWLRKYGGATTQPAQTDQDNQKNALAAWLEKYNNFTPSGADTVQPPAGTEAVVPSTQPNGYKSQNAAQLSSGLSRDDFDSSVRNRNQYLDLEKSIERDRVNKINADKVMTVLNSRPGMTDTDPINTPALVKNEKVSLGNDKPDVDIPYYDYNSNRPETVIKAIDYSESTGKALESLKAKIDSGSSWIKYYESSVNRYADRLERLAGEMQRNPTAANYREYNSLYAEYQNAYAEYENQISEYNSYTRLYNNYANRYGTATALIQEYNEQWQKSNKDFFEKSEIGTTAFEADKRAQEQKILDDIQAQNNRPWWQKLLDAWTETKHYKYAGEGELIGESIQQQADYYRSDTSYKEPSDKWTESEKMVFGYLYSTDPEKAGEFATMINNIDNREKTDKQKKAIADWTTKNFGTGLGGTLAALILSPTAIADYADNIAEYLGRGQITEKDHLSPFDVSQAFTGGISEELNELSGTIDKSVPIFGGKGLGDIYSLGYSVAQSMSVGSLNFAPATLLYFFGQAAASGVDEKLAAGGSAEQALGFGFVAGAAEAICENIGIEHLFGSNSKNLLTAWLKQSGVEATEEGITSIINTVADGLIMMDKSQFETAVSEYQKFMSQEEAEKLALNDIIGAIMFDTIGGFVSGGADTVILAGANKVGNTVRTEKAKASLEQTIKNADAVIKAYGEAVQKYGENSPQALELKSKSERAYIEKVRANLRLGMLNGKSTTVTTQERSEEEITKLVAQAQAAGDATAETGYYSGASDQLIKFAQQEKAILKQLTGRDVDIRFYQADVGENGHYDPKTGTIYVNVNSERPFSYIEGHEFTHELENSAGYAEYAEWVKTEGLGAMYNTYKENIKRRYESRGINLTELELEQEVVATWTGENLFTDDTTMKKLIKKLSDGKPTLARKIFGGIRRFVSRSRSGITRNHYERALYLYQQMAQGKASAVSSAQTVNENAPTSFPAETAKVPQKQKNTVEAVNTAENDIMISNGEAVAQDNGKITNDSEFTPAVRELVDRIADTARQIEASDQKGADYRRLKKEQKANLRALEQLRRDGKIDSVEYNRAIEALRDTTEGPEYGGIEESKANLQAQFEAGEIALEDYESAMAELEEVGAEESSPGKIKYSLSETIAPTRKELESKNPIKVVNVRVGLESESYSDMKVAAKNKATNEGWFDIPHHNVDTDSFIFLTDKSFTHAFSNLRSDFGEDTIRCMAHIPEIIQEAVLVSVDNPKDNRKAETKVYTFFGAIDGVNGVEPVKLTVKEFDFRSLDAVPQNIRNYFEKNGISEKYNSLYDTHALEVIGIEGIQKESDASGRVGEQSSRAQATSDSVISIADLLNLVKGKAENYIPKYSFEDLDSEYLNAVNSGDMETAQRLVEEAAKISGYTDKVYHGTTQFGFTVFDPKYSDDGISLFATDSTRLAQTYSGVYGTRSVQSAFPTNDLSSLGQVAELFINSGAAKESFWDDSEGYPEGDIEYEVITSDDVKTLHNDIRKGTRKIKEQLESIIKITTDSSKRFQLEKILERLNNCQNVFDGDLYNAIANIPAYTGEFVNDKAFLKLVEKISLAYKLNIYGANKGGIRMYMDSETRFVGIDEMARRLEEESDAFRGNYSILARPGNQLVIEGDGAQWHSIFFPKEEGFIIDSTRGIAQYAKEHGYDSVKIKDIKDAGMKNWAPEEDPHDVYIFFNPNDLKSADTVTYDEDGNVIPLSERFNSEKTDIRFSLEDPTREDVISELRQYMSGARSKDQIRDVIARVKKNPQSEIYGGPAKRPQYSEGVQKILADAEREGMSVRDYISQNIDEFEVRGKLIEDARKALEISGDYRKFSVEDVRANRPPRSIEELDRILAEAEPLDPNEFRKTDFDRWYERREKEDQLHEKMGELVMKAPDENEINTTLEELASDLENGYITPDAALEIVEGLRAETDRDGGVKYSISETEDGRPVVVVDNDILSHLDTSSWDRNKRKAAQNAAKNALLNFKDGVRVGDVLYKVNRTSRKEFTRSEDTMKIYKKNEQIFADKMRASENIDDVVSATTNWKNDGDLEHERDDNFVDFIHGNVLIQANVNKYRAETVVGITDEGDCVFYDVVDITPIEFKTKKESPPAVSDIKAVNNILGDSFGEIVPQDPEVVKSAVKKSVEDVEVQSIEESSDGAAMQNYNRLYEGGEFKDDKTAKSYQRFFPAEAVEYLRGKYRITNEQEAAEAYQSSIRLKDQVRRTELRLKISEQDKALALEILCGDKSISDIQNTSDKEGLLEYIAVLGEAEVMAEAWKNWKTEKRSEWQKEADGMYKTFDSSVKGGFKYDKKGNIKTDKRGNPKFQDDATNKAGYKYVRETQTRITYDIFADDKFAEAKAFNDWLFEPERASEAQSNRYKNKMRDQVRELKLGTNIQKGNAVSESAAVQILGELQDIIRRTKRQADMGNADTYRVNGITYNEAVWSLAELKKQNPNMDFSENGKIQKAVEKFGQLYAEMLSDMNQTLVRNGYPPVPARSGYFPHFADEGDTLIRRIGRALGIDTDVSVLPTGINGLTHTFKPGKTWFANALERKGHKTAYDAVLGFDKYIEGAANVIFHTDNIQRQRYFARAIRYNASDEAIKSKIDEIIANDTLNEDEKDLQIQYVTSRTKFRHSTYVVQLEDHTNSLAGKKTFSDRDMERLMGRKAYTWMKNIEGRVAANMIAGNLSSALSNFIPLQYCKAEIGEWQTLRAMAETLRSFARDDGFVDRSDFLTNRYGSEFLVKSGIDKVSEKLSIPMEAIDHFTAQVLVRAAYNKYLKKGASPELAMERANSFAAGVMADRSRGALPEIFNNKNPLYKSFTMFQVEVNNNLSHIFKDIPREYRDENKAKWIGAVAWILAKLFFGIWIFNETSEKIVGRRMAGTDVVDAANEVAGDLSGYQLPNTWDLIEAIFKGEDISAMFEANKVGAGQAILNLGETAAEDVPFVSSLFGGGDIPVGSALPDLSTILPLIGSEKDGENIKQTLIEEGLKPVSYALLPFGVNQASKIHKGISALAKGGSYKTNSKGEEILQYPIYSDNILETAWDHLRVFAFGKSATDQSREWVDSGFKSLSARGTAAYKGMIAAGVDEGDAHSLIIDIMSVEPTDQEIEEKIVSMGGVDRVFSETVSNGPTSTDLKCEIIRNADISDEGKAILYFAMIANESECNFMSSLQEAGADMGAVVAELLDKKTGSDAHKYSAIMSSGLPEAEQLWQIYLLDTSAEKSTHKRYYVASDTFGISPNEYRVANDFLTNYLDGNRKTNERVAAAVREYAETVPLTKTEKAVLWQLLSKSTSAKNNPFDVRTGERVLTAINNYDREEEEFYAKYGPQPQ